MKIYTIIGGVNGAGKSSLTGVLKAELTDLGKIVDVDKLNSRLGGKLAGGRAAIRTIENCLCGGVCFTQETTLSGMRTARTARRAKELDYYVRLYYVSLNSAQECVARIKNRVQKGGHDIPEADVQRRFASRYSDLAAVLPYCDEAFFFDNENGFLQVAEFRNGELLLMGERRPYWIVQLREYLETQNWN